MNLFLFLCHTAIDFDIDFNGFLCIIIKCLLVKQQYHKYTQ